MPQPSRQRLCLDPSGYQPVYVDEESLTEDDRKQAVIADAAHPCDWMSHVTGDELRSLKASLAQAETKKKKGHFFYPTGESTAQREIRYELARQGTLRAFARAKYNEGQPVWFGDVPPWLF